MSATNKDSDKEAERPSNDGGENPGGSKGDGGKENPGGSKGDGGKENPSGSKGDGGKENPGATPGKTEIARRGKFEFASDLSNYIHKVREEYWKCLESDKEDKQFIGVVLYIVEKFSLRSGTKDPEFLDDPTGVCRLKNGHITFPEDGSVHFHFNGKSNITYDKIHPVEPKVYDILKERATGRESEDLFPGTTAQQVNECLKGIMPGLTMRVFRTYNGSLIMQNELENATPPFNKNTCKKSTYH
ncbi:DNA topoisomerase 1-like [Neodiprion virginianus]|uniref:DNA topoisomerase 1-like n=1 Tax=Neodiprion virginianus TaxID=2961670 RepID=UPI001EE78117|nr:DNA topoisomerase 1-like [Neodiprion virginianus]